MWFNISMHRSVVLETERVLLRRPKPSAAQGILDFELQNRSFFERWMPVRDEAFFTLNCQINLIAEELQEMKAGRKVALWLFPREDDSGSGQAQFQTAMPIGSIIFSNIVRGAFLSCFLGYRLDAGFTGYGYMQESLSRAVRYIFEDVGLHRIEANIMPENAPSRKLAESCGFCYEGSSPSYLKIRGVWEEHMHYVLLNKSSDLG